MKVKEIKKRIAALLMAVAFTFTSVPVYADEPDVATEEAVENVESSESNDSGENETVNADEASDDIQVLEVSVTLISEETPGETPVETTEESKVVASEETENSEVLETEVPPQAEITENNTEVSEQVDTVENNAEDSKQVEVAEDNAEVSNSVNLETVNSESGNDESADSESDEKVINSLADTEKETTKETAKETDTASVIKETIAIDEVEITNTSVAKAADALAGKSIDKDSLIAELMTQEMKDVAEGIRTQYSKSIESVTTSMESTGRYSVSFTVTEKNESTGEVKKFQYSVSGFASEEDIQDFLKYMSNTNISSSNTRYLYSNDNLVDAEKKIWYYEAEKLINPDADPMDDYDSNHCWAGSASDMLVLSGWNKADSVEVPDGYNNFSDEDDVFDYFNHNYDDNAGNANYGIMWFFSGMNITETSEGWSHLKNEAGYNSPVLKDYCVQNFTYYALVNSEDQLLELLKNLDGDSDGDKCALGLVIGYYKNDEDGNPVLDEDGEQYRAGGHCITIAGYSTDENGVPSSLVIIDSDSYNSNGQPESSKDNDERAYKNTYTTYPLRFFDGKWHLMNYYLGDKYDTIIDEIDVLKYYSDNTKGKVEQGGTKDLINNVDIFVDKLATVSNDDMDIDCYTFYENEGISLWTYIQNFSNVFTDLGTNTLTYRVEITKGGTVVSACNYIQELENDNFTETSFYRQFLSENAGLEPGEYEVNLILNPDREITEAYYNNNIRGVKFIIIKRIDSDGNEHYEVVEAEENNNNNQNPISNTVTDIFDYSFVEDQSDYIGNPMKNFNFRFKGGFEDVVLTDADFDNAEVLFNYSVSGELTGTGINFSSNVSITKDDYRIVRNADGTFSIVFSNAFMKKLPKGTHYFKLLIGGKIRTFKIEIK